jgi:thiamine monophosphate synthase
LIWIITSPERIHEEERIIAALLSAGASRVLVRKPDWTTEEYAALLDGINPDYYDRLLIRDQPVLAAEYGLAGVHWSGAARAFYEAQLCDRNNADSKKGSVTEDAKIVGKNGKLTYTNKSKTLTKDHPAPDFTNSVSFNSATPLTKEEGMDKDTGNGTINVQPTAEERSEKNTAERNAVIRPFAEKIGSDNSSSPEKLISNSTGIHTATEITYTSTRYSTLLLSPVFDSISKTGYHGRAGGMLTNKDHRPVLALGGVNHTNIILLKQWQFDGAALLGAIWKTPAKAVENYYRIQQLWNKSDLTS